MDAIKADTWLAKSHQQYDKYRDVKFEEGAPDDIKKYNKKVQRRQSVRLEDSNADFFKIGEKNMKAEEKIIMAAAQKAEQIQKTADGRLSIASLKSEIRHKILNELRAAYHHHMEEGLLKPQAWFHLDQSVAFAIDYSYMRFRDLEYLKDIFEPNMLQKCLMKGACLKCCTVGMMFERHMIGYDAIINFIDCRHEVYGRLSTVFADVHDQNEELMDAELHLI